MAIVPDPPFVFAPLTCFSDIQCNHRMTTSNHTRHDRSKVIKARHLLIVDIDSDRNNLVLDFGVMAELALGGMDVLFR